MSAAALSAGAERARRRLRRPLAFRLFLLARVPLAAAAGLRLVELDAERCVVRLPGGWRTQNPFRSTYFAAQCMAAELSTGAPAGMLVAGAPASLAMLVRKVEAAFVKKAVGATLFSCEDVGALQAAIARAAESGEAQEFVARSTGRMLDGTVVATVDVTWSFKRRDPR